MLLTESLPQVGTRIVAINAGNVLIGNVDAVRDNGTVHLDSNINPRIGWTLYAEDGWIWIEDNTAEVTA